MEIECEVEKGEEIDIVCPRCSGSGQRTIEVQDADPIVITCEWCSGTGISTAYSCGGSDILSGDR